MNDAVALKVYILAGLSIAISTIGQGLGGWDVKMILLLSLMAADYITGVLIAALWKKSNKSKSGTLSSTAGFKGLCKKGVILLVVWIGTQLDLATGTEYIRTAAILFYMGNEGISLIENMGIMGVPFPAPMKKAFEAMQEKGSKEK